MNFLKFCTQMPKCLIKINLPFNSIKFEVPSYKPWMFSSDFDDFSERVGQAAAPWFLDPSGLPDGVPHFP